MQNISYFINEQWKQPKCPSAEEQTHNTWYIHPEYYPAIERNEVLTWMNLESIMLRETHTHTHTHKDKYCIICSYEIPRIDKFIETENRGYRAGGKNGALLLHRHSLGLG